MKQLRWSAENFSSRARYCRWWHDTDFTDYYENGPRCLRLGWGQDGDISKLHELWDTVRQTRDLQGDIIEVGVYNGWSAGFLSKSASLYTPDSTVYLCDTCAGLVDLTDEDTTDFRMGQFRIDFPNIESHMTKVGADNWILLDGYFPFDTGRFISECVKIKVCHLDVDTHVSMVACLGWTWSRLVEGGVIIVDDYGENRMAGVVLAVEKFVAKHKNNIRFFYNINGHAIIVRIK